MIPLTCDNRKNVNLGVGIMAMGGFAVDLKKEVQDHFDQIRESINVREKLLLRQIDVISSQSQNNVSTLQEVNFIPEGKEDLLNAVRAFGKFNLDNLNFATDIYANEDYISPSVDHETMYKCLQSKGDRELANGNEEKIVVDFSSNKKLIKENVNSINESIINITLNEAKELIRKTKPLDTLKLEKELISQSSQTEKNNKGIKANITINNCNGTINLKNISNLTINCAKEDSLNVENKGSDKRFEEPQNQYEGSGTPSDTNSTKDNENNSVNCEFYNRLISEIKNSLKQGCRPNDNIPGGNQSLNEHYSKGSSDSSSSDSYSRKFLLKNFENLKIVLENNENETRPIQIEQWLAEIISETEIEPMQNPEILEHSKIHGKDVY